MPHSMSESNTPYTPGGTPSINSDVDPARLLPQLQQHFPRGITADPKVYSALAAVARQQQQQDTQKKAQWGAVGRRRSPAHTASKQTASSASTNTYTANPDTADTDATGLPTISTVRLLSAAPGSNSNSDNHLWIPADIQRQQGNWKRE